MKDFKLYDIPNTVKLRAQNIPADIVSIHASGGLEMMKQAVASGKEIFAVTMLTSFSIDEVKQIYNREVDDIVLAFARLAKQAGVSGIVCSPKEIKLLKDTGEFDDIKIVVPGIRSTGINTNDQNRVSTPKEAVQNGADYLVIGREITQAEDPILALSEIQKYE